MTDRGNGAKVVRDDDIFTPGGVVCVNEVMISSDEEDEMEREGNPIKPGDGGIELITIRPKSKSRLLANPNLDPEGEAMIIRNVVAEDRADPLNLEEKTGFVKECVEDEGLAVIYSAENGLVVFHQEHCFHDCARVDFSTFKEVFTPGIEVHFLDTYHEGEEFKCVSSEGFIRQAAAVWVGPRPNHLLRQLMSDQHGLQMRHHRKRFLHYVRSEAFMSVPLTRVSGNITGYLTDKIGLIETTEADAEGNHKMIVFCVDDIHLYGKPVKETLARTRRPIDEVVPVGIRVIFDARNVAKFRGVEFQAVAIFVGKWPQTPHPTLLPCGDGSLSVCYEIPEGQTFHYLQLSLAARQDDQMMAFKERANTHGTELRKSRFAIDSGKEFFTWQEKFGPAWKLKDMQDGKHRHRKRGPPQKRKTLHEFKKLDPKGEDPTVAKKLKVKSEVKTEVKREAS